MAAVTGIKNNYIYERSRRREEAPLSPSDLEGFDPVHAPEEPLSAHSEIGEAGELEAAPKKAAFPPVLKELFFLDLGEIERRISGLTESERREALDAVSCFALIARFREEHIPEVIRVYNISPDEFFEEQLKIARFNRAIGVRPSDSLSLKMETWAQEKNKRESTVEMVEGGRLMMVDSLYGRTRVGDFCMFTPIRGRYDWVVRNCLPKFPPDLVEMNPTFRDQNRDIVTLDDGVSYALLYPNPANPEELWQLTAKTGEGALPHTSDAFWFHTPARYIQPLLRHLDELYAELRKIGERMQVNPGLEKAFYEQLAHVYWLAANICRTPRGNAQYCLNFLYHEMKRWGLPLLIPRVGVMPDCVALSLPLEVFQDRFLSLFENLGVAKRILGFSDK